MMMIAKTNGTTAALSEFASQIRYENIAAEVLARTRICLLDYLGAAAVGIATQEARLARKYASTVGGSTQSQAFGMKQKTSMPLAALVNGLTCHACELDDAHRYATGLHPAATIIPAVLAIGEPLCSPWEDILPAIIAGYEIAGRVGKAINPSHRYRGFHSTGTIATLGAAAAGSRMLGLDCERTSWAIGIAGSLAGGIFAFLTEGSMNKLLHAGNAAANGVTAALLAQSGFTGPSQVLEDKEGFCRAFSDEYDLDSITRGIGNRYQIEDTYFKQYASCGQSFGAIDAIIDMREEVLASQSEIKNIRIETFRAAAVLDNKTPDTIRKAKFSIPFVSALALLKGRVGHFDFDANSLDDHNIMELAQKVDVIENEKLTSEFPRKRTAIVTIKLADGQLYIRQVDIPRGMPENPLSDEDLLFKFKTLTTSIIGEKRSEIVAASIINSDNKASIYSLMNLR